MQEQNNPPAFPSHGSMGEVVQEGMDLRDFFASQTLCALIQSGKFNREPLEEAGRFESSAMAVSRISYKYADAMLAQRLKSSSNA